MASNIGDEVQDSDKYTLGAVHDLQFPQILQMDKKIIPKDMKQGKLMLPVLLYHCLFQIFEQDKEDEESELP